MFSFLFLFLGGGGGGGGWFAPEVCPNNDENYQRSDCTVFDWWTRIHFAVNFYVHVYIKHLILWMWHVLAYFVSNDFAGPVQPIHLLILWMGTSLNPQFIPVCLPVLFTSLHLWRQYPCSHEGLFAATDMKLSGPAGDGAATPPHHGHAKCIILTSVSGFSHKRSGRYFVLWIIENKMFFLIIIIIMLKTILSNYQ